MPAERHAPVGAGALEAMVTTIFAQCDMDHVDARLLARSLVDADLRGVHSHGVLRVPEYVAKLTEGGVNPRGQPAVVQDHGVCLVVDGGNSMGVIGAHFAMRAAMARAATSGLAAVAIRGSNHCGALAFIARQALDQDMIGLATTNALPTMAPWGGAERLLGINPLAVAIPAGNERPIVYDAAFSGAAHGKIRVYHNQGRPLPAGWALDRHGQPTTDPAAALEGLLLPIGGYKGSGLALVMGLLSALLSGAAYGTELGTMETGPRAGVDGHFVLALRVSAFTDLAQFKARVDGVIRQWHACRLAPGFEGIYAPGEQEGQTEDRYRRAGIPLDEPTWAGLYAAARRVGLEPAALDQVGGA